MKKWKHLGSYNELTAVLWLMKQGYEVFRNVSAHGLIDIVAYRDGQLTKFDVKSARLERQPVSLTQEQIDAGVIGLKVYHDGRCEIGETLGKQEPVSCKGCGALFQRRTCNERQVFCSKQCRKTSQAKPSEEKKTQYQEKQNRKRERRRAEKLTQKDIADDLAADYYRRAAREPGRDARRKGT